MKKKKMLRQKSYIGAPRPFYESSKPTSVYNSLTKNYLLCVESFLKGEVRRIFFYWLKVFISSKLREVSKGNFHRKAQKLVKNHIKG